MLSLSKNSAARENKTLWGSGDRSVKVRLKEVS